MKRIEMMEDGQIAYYRERRGKLVRIPDKWVGRVPTAQAIRQRDSKINGSLKRVVKDVGLTNRYKDRRAQLKVEDY